MEMTQNIHTAVTVAIRYNVLNTSAKNARNAIGRLRFDAFAESLTEEQMATLKAAENIAALVENKTSLHDAEKYLKTLQD